MAWTHPEAGRGLCSAVAIFPSLEVFGLALAVGLGGGMGSVLLPVLAAVFTVVVASAVAGFGCA